MDNKAGPSKPKKRKYEDDLNQDDDESNNSTDTEFSEDALSDDEDEQSVKNETYLGWESTGELKTLPFTPTNITLKPTGEFPIDYFNLFFTDDFLSKICDDTNANAKRLDSKDLPCRTKVTKWKHLTIEEMRIFIGVIFHMGSMNMIRLADYWKTDELFSIEIFRKCMTLFRFRTILKCLNFSSELEKSKFNQWYKVSTLVDFFNKKMIDCYYPSKQLFINEGMIAHKGRVTFRSKMHNHQYVSGKKIYEISDVDGVVIKCCLEKTVGFNRVRNIKCFLHQWLHRGHELYMNSYFNQHDVAKALLNSGTYCTGPLSENLKSQFPEPIVLNKMKEGEHMSYYREGVRVGRWKKGLYITTQYKDKMVQYTNKDNVVSLVPEAVARYDHYMQKADIQEEVLIGYPLLYLRHTWYLKMAFHIFQLFLLNSYKLHSKFSKQPRMTFSDYRLSVIHELLAGTDNRRTKPRVEKGGKSEDNTRHVINKRTVSSGEVCQKTSESNGEVCQKTTACCKLCQKKYYCTRSPDEPAICPECFQYHNDILWL